MHRCGGAFQPMRFGRDRANTRRTKRIAWWRKGADRKTRKSASPASRTRWRYGEERRIPELESRSCNTAPLATVGPFAYLASMIAIALILAMAAPDAAEAPVTAYAQCLADNARALDDGKSDATTIAQIVRVECRPQERTAALALAGDADNFGAIVAGIEAGGLSRAVRAVLRIRTASPRQ